MDNEFPDNERQRFKSLSLSQQVMELFDSLRANRGEIAKLMRVIIDYQEDQFHYRTIREQKEMSTEQKIETMLNKRFDFWTYFRDKVLPSVLTFITMGLLYVVFKP